MTTRLARTDCENAENRHCLGGSWPVHTYTLQDWVTHENDGPQKTRSTQLEQPEDCKVDQSYLQNSGIVQSMIFLSVHF